MKLDSDDESSSNEKETLLKQDTQQDEYQENKLSKVRELSMMFTLLFVQYIALCSDGIIFPFFPLIAAKRGINSLSIGVVFASYDVSRFIGSLAFGSMVSTENCKRFLTFFQTLSTACYYWLKVIAKGYFIVKKMAVC